MKEEDKIMKTYGTKNPFSVPEGYFDNLTDEIMSKLPEKKEYELPKKITTWEKVRPWFYMAAMFIAILLPIRLMINSTVDNADTETIAITAIGEEQQDALFIDEYIDVMLSQSMMDDYTLYRYLTDADTDMYN